MAHSILPHTPVPGEGNVDHLIPEPQRAGRAVYNIPEVKQHILRQLSNHDLASFMRVEKKGMADVASVLYHTMAYSQVRSRMSMSTARQRTYLGAIRVINAETMNLGHAMLKKTELVIKNPRRRAAETQQYLREYHSDVFNLVVPPMRKKCENLRRMIFGSSIEYPGYDAWTVDFYTPMAAKTGESATAGQIDLVRRLRPSLEDLSTLTTPPAPTDQYVMNMRVNLKIQIFSDFSPSLIKGWLLALQDTRCTNALYKYIDTGDLPVTLGLITDLYRGQIEAGHVTRLERITTERISPFGIDDFRTFAKVAASSLVSLVFNNGYRYSERHVHPALTFDDLPQVVAIIRDSLPRLSELCLEMAASPSSPLTLHESLHKKSLETRGTIKVLYIFTVGDLTPIARLNAVRLVSSICLSEAQISVNSYGASRTSFEYPGFNNQPEPETTALQYLRNQLPNRRDHLSTIDFSSIGVTQLKDLLDLEYHSDGRPMGLSQTRVYRLDLPAAIWRATEADTLGIFELQREPVAWVQLAEELEEAATTKSTPILLKLAQELSAKLLYTRATSNQQRNLAPVQENLQQFIHSLSSSLMFLQ